MAQGPTQPLHLVGLTLCSADFELPLRLLRNKLCTYGPSKLEAETDLDLLQSSSQSSQTAEGSCVEGEG